MLKSPRQKNQEIRLMYITTHTTRETTIIKARAWGINKLIMDQHGTRKETNREAHGGITTMHGDIKVAQQGANQF
jgi:hypothetical protein